MESLWFNGRRGFEHDLPKEGLVKEIRFTADQLVVCPDVLVDDVAAYLSALEEAAAVEEPAGE